MDRREHEWTRVRRVARRILGRFADRCTRALHEDMVQDVCLLLWQWRARVGAVTRFDAATRTVCYRHRRRRLDSGRRGAWLQFVEFGVEGVAEPCAPEDGEEPVLRIAGRKVPLTWATTQLPRVLARLSAFDRQLLCSFHEGFCCAELAERFGRSEDCIKTRIHRARRRVRQQFESLVRRSAGFEEPEVKEER